MSRRRLALASLVACLLCGLVGGPVASAATTSAAAKPTATTAATKKKAKRPTVSTLNKRLTKTEKDLKAARRQLRIVQRATAALVGSLDAITGGSSIENLLGTSIDGVVTPQVTKIQEAISTALNQLTAQNLANLVAGSVSNPAVRKSFEDLLTGIFGVPPTQLAASLNSIGPAVKSAVDQAIVLEQPVVIARVGGVAANPVVGPDLPDDLNPTSVTGQVVVTPTTNAAQTVELLAGVRTAENDTPAAKVRLESLTVEAFGANASGGFFQSISSALLVGQGIYEAPKISRTVDATTAPSLDLAAASRTTAGSVITVSNASGKPVILRFTVSYVDDSPTD